jgi:hypothetical protein
MTELTVSLRAIRVLERRISEQSLISIKVGGRRNRYGEYCLRPARRQDAEYN